MSPRRDKLRILRFLLRRKLPHSVVSPLSSQTHFVGLCLEEKAELFQYSILNGGDKRDRTVDLLLARQALSQLSYTPIYLCRTFLHFSCVPSKLNNVLSTQNSSPDV